VLTKHGFLKSVLLFGVPNWILQTTEKAPLFVDITLALATGHCSLIATLNTVKVPKAELSKTLSAFLSKRFQQ